MTVWTFMWVLAGALLALAARLWFGSEFVPEAELVVLDAMLTGALLGLLARRVALWLAARLGTARKGEALP